MRALAISTSVVAILAGTVSAQDAAHPGYWDNLYQNTIRYTLRYGQPDAEVVDIWFNEDKSVTTNKGYTGKWWIEQPGESEQFCYDMNGLPGDPATLNECFALRLMYNPRIGAEWVAAFKEGIVYHAIVVKGRDADPAE